MAHVWGFSLHRYPEVFQSAFSTESCVMPLFKTDRKCGGHYFLLSFMSFHEKESFHSRLLYH
jgi:hypothetical protein